MKRIELSNKEYVFIKENSDDNDTPILTQEYRMNILTEYFANKISLYNVETKQLKIAKNRYGVTHDWRKLNKDEEMDMLQLILVS